MSSNGIVFNLKKRHIIMKVNEETEYRVVMGCLKKKLPELRSRFEDSDPEFYIMGKDFSNREINAIQKLVEKYFDVNVNFSETKILGLYGIRKTFYKNVAISKTKFIRNSLRSGQKVEFEGSIVLLGDVNYGAEVIAGENIVVIGVLRGLAHAGAGGNKGAMISAGSILSKQIRIADIIKEFNSEDDDGSIKTTAYLNEKDEVVLE